ncbi:hypothetical protein ABZ636_22170 [Streptomyces sp. NPDC007251]|uniref:hypothetical protein n=1 Tax=unclassified Streptomyces TaxID=2593676 RepID=UPI0033C2037C
MTAEIGAYAEESPFARVIRSGLSPNSVVADMAPVRPNAVTTSSARKRMSFLRTALGEEHGKPVRGAGDAQQVETASSVSRSAKCLYGQASSQRNDRPAPAMRLG